MWKTLIFCVPQLSKCSRKHTNTMVYTQIMKIIKWIFYKLYYYIMIYNLILPLYGLKSIKDHGFLFTAGVCLFRSLFRHFLFSLASRY